MFLRLSHARVESEFLRLSIWDQPAKGHNPDSFGRMAGYPRQPGVVVNANVPYVYSFVISVM
jgi:hypothetical protein